MSSRNRLAWHFLAADRRMANEGEIVEPGYIYSAVGPLELCCNGMHASVRALDAIGYAPGPIVCRVRCSGQIIHDGDKLVCRHREVLWMADATTALRLLACRFVRETPLGDGRKVWDLLTDPRSREAVDVAERYARGEATERELDAATAAAWDAARAAGSDAATAAARAAWAASDAVWSAATDAAWDAATDAAWAGAADDAWSAAWAAQEQMAEGAMLALAPKEKR